MGWFEHMSDIQWLGLPIIALLIWIGFNVHDINRKM